MDGEVFYTDKIILDIVPKSVPLILSQT
jgi:hypothetical protein